ncbi:putative RING finger protein [Corchorus olitorius]|uniref:RING finger protein n=1 Tax=Corchorus olitorius TaxID=93759 RepID=A0A1R3JMB9_9ROSI|nr:putative RING finger protein [Corchorus olitorius]
MSTLELRSGSSHRGYRRKKNLLDLNVPPSEIREQEGTSQQAGPEQLTSQPVQPVRLEPRVTIDVEDIDDDVESIEPREFDEAVKNNSKRTHVYEQYTGFLSICPCSRSTYLVAGHYLFLSLFFGAESLDYLLFLVAIAEISLLSGRHARLMTRSQYNWQVEEIRKPQPPPKEPTFNCPICMATPAAEHTATRKLLLRSWRLVDGGSAISFSLLCIGIKLRCLGFSCRQWSVPGSLSQKSSHEKENENKCCLTSDFGLHSQSLTLVASASPQPRFIVKIVMIRGGVITELLLLLLCNGELVVLETFN